jgi:Bacterial PH domain
MTAPHRATSYPSRIDFFLVGLPALLLFAAALFGWRDLVRTHLGMLLVPLLAGCGFVAWVVAATRYTLDSATLTVRSGPLRWTVPLSEIHSVTPTREPRSSPALSMDRLRIDYGHGRSLLISPASRISSGGAPPVAAKASRTPLCRRPGSL